MNRTRFNALALICLIWACEDKSSNEDTYIAEGETTFDPPPMAFAVTWDGEQIDLIIAGGYGEFMFGLAETTCEGECWYGEDCIYGDSSGMYFYCHPSESDGVSLRYGAEPETLQEGEETVFADPSFEDRVTYYLKSVNDDGCWIWGDDISYYADLDCDYGYR